MNKCTELLVMEGKRDYLDLLPVLSCCCSSSSSSSSFLITGFLLCLLQNSPHLLQSLQPSLPFLQVFVCVTPQFEQKRAFSKQGVNLDQTNDKKNEVFVCIVSPYFFWAFFFSSRRIFEMDLPRCSCEGCNPKKNPG